MDNIINLDIIDYNNVNNITFVNKIIKNDSFNYILEIDINKTSNNIKYILSTYQSESCNCIKINVKPNYKYKIIDSNNNIKYEQIKNINFNNKLIKINLEFCEKYSNFYIKQLIVFDNKENKQVNNKKYNINKNVLVKKITYELGLI